ncbi:MAG: hypothetical protein M1831_005077 [Alyxoria varia]|nr:MAG: hypothetical protein M1831_005077 [Alyxoria varia]
MPKNAQARTADEGSLHESKAQEHSPGSGPQFKSDLLRYLAAYGQKRTGPLVDQLKVYDFSTAKVALVASVPSSLFNDKDRKQTDWGWPALRKILSLIPSTTKQTERPCIVAQVSSVATLGERWISHFFDLLSTTRPNLDSPAEKSPLKPKCRIMFPTAEEVRLSLDGYASGSSIHTKLKSAPAKKQLSLLRPMLVHWSGEKGGSNPPSQLMLSSGQTASESNQTSKTREAGRDRAAPHIKTYIRFANEAMDSIDWALLSSANLSTQAWGAMEKDGKVRICSYEIGVVVWPGLFENNINVLQVSDERHSSEHAGMKNPKGEEENSSSETESDPPDSTSHESSSTDKGTFTADSTLPAGLGKSSKEKLPAAEPPQNDNESETESDPEPSTSIPETKREHQSIMVPTFMKDKPSLEEQDAGSASSKAANPASKTTVGLRLPYNLPLVPYHLDEDPWGKELDYEEPDSKGVVWTST